MANRQLTHDVAFVTSLCILDVYSGWLSEEELCDFFAEVFERVKAGIECFELQSKRRFRRFDSERN